MIVKVKLFAGLRAHLPEDARDGSIDLEVPDTTTARDIIERLEIPEQLAHLVMIDGYHLLPKQVQERPLKAGEELAIFPPIAGGR